MTTPPASLMCKMCTTAPPIKNSHVIPEFMYKQVYDPKHRFLPWSTDEFSQPQIEQLGYREALLCTKCEGRLSQWEAELKRFVDALMNPPAHGMSVVDDSTNTLVFDGVNYEPVKRAILSIVWRMSIAEDEPWQAYDLGLYDEKIRQVLLSDDPIPPEHYPVAIALPLHNGKSLPGFILLYKKRSRFETLSGHTFIAHGVMFTIYSTDSRFPVEYSPGVLNDSGYTPVEQITLAEIAQRDIKIDMNSSFNARAKKFYSKT